MLDMLLGLWPQLLGIGAMAVTILGVFLGIRQGGIDAQKAEDQENALEQATKVGDRISKAQDAGNYADRELSYDSERLREDDGHRRKD